ncbi:toxin [Chania multitudinisentens RB-25]|uniref:Toxin n=1 Tax=Chania multitudinisentens RB-25 TaxID=1441930 RepID=W0LAK4_9GAMM|nr:type II toxin-antitoxin system death-on-curing family toxin [Chania multitudinisentens]AHG19312.1 toxin [Chania multitudinisentens RB-25]
MKWVNASEIVIFHDRILQLYPGVAGMPDAGRAEAIIHRVHNFAHYEGVNDVFDLAAAYWVAIARGHIFNDDNKRTAFFTTMAFLRRNGVLIRDEGNTLEELTVQAATGELTPIQLAQSLRELAE